MGDSGWERIEQWRGEEGDKERGFVVRSIARNTGRVVVSEGVRAEGEVF